jgi:hypothetical protein
MCGQPIGPLAGHLYSAEEVRARLERANGLSVAKGYTGHRGFSGVSGTSGLWPYSNDLFESKIIKPPKNYSAQRAAEYLHEKLHIDPIAITYSEEPIRPRSFSVRAFVREAVDELKTYFKPLNKKENKHD